MYQPTAVLGHTPNISRKSNLSI
ncbi:hypothetical protein BCEN4_1010044 [Burkholderia cenocepacia]|nr:hypothetical protein BCEN4_1010044 [Burkholderia cenocepacia]